MGSTEQQYSQVFSESRQPREAINQYGLCQTEWWLSVNYAELIEVRDAVGIQALRARAAS